MVFLATFGCLIVTLALLLYYFIKRKYTFWERHGIPHDKPLVPHGNIKGFMQTRHGREIMQEFYEKYKGSGPFVGMYFYFTPVALVLDLDLARDVLIKDFHNFMGRGMYSNERDDPLSAHLFSLEGDKWRAMRNKMSPTFTSGKMKLMLPIIADVADELRQVLAQTIEADPVVEIKDIMARFTTDVIGTCAFGIECNSLKDPNVEFRKVGISSFTKKRHGKFVEGLMMGFPNLARKLGMRMIHEDIHQFFTRMVRETVEYREKNSVQRNDFMGLMIELKNSGSGLTIDQIAAQAFIFFAAGFDLSSITMGFALYELALNQDIQDKLRAEVNSRFDKHDGHIVYEDLSEMTYLEQVVKETQRKYSVNLSLMRLCKEDYRTSDPKYVIPKGTMVLIQAHAFQNDPDIYPNPDEFDPERFSPEETLKRHPLAWLPFGDGPRNCIGLRFAKMQMNVGLAVMVRNFKFQCCEKTPIPIDFDLKSPFLNSKGGIHLKVERINP